MERGPYPSSSALFLASARTNLGELETRSGKAADALPWFDGAVEGLGRIPELEPKHAVARYYLSCTHAWKVRALERRWDGGTTPCGPGTWRSPTTTEATRS